MINESPVTDNLQQSVQSHGWRLWFSRHNWLTWLGLSLILPLVLYYWQHYSEHLRQQQQAVFQQYADNIETELQQRLKHIELLLAANAAYVSSSEYVSQAEWQHYVQSLKLPQLYPGIQALGIVSYRSAAELPVLLGQLSQELQRQQRLEQKSAAQSNEQITDQQPVDAKKSASQPLPIVNLHPAGEREHYAIVSHIQPATLRNRKVLGYDMLTDPLRTQTAMRAASLNQPAITAKVSLLQDSRAQPQAGLVLMLPLYRYNVPLVTAEQKQAALQGFVYAAFRVADILPASWHDPTTVLPDIQWASGLETDEGQLLFERITDTAAATSTNAFQRSSLALQQHRHLDWYGQPFVLLIKSNPLFELEELPLAEYELVVLGSIALILLFLLLSYLNLRRYQAECSVNLSRQQVQLQRQFMLQDEHRQSLALKASQLAWFEFDLRSGGAFYADLWWRMFDFSAPQPNPEPQQLFDLLHPSALALFRQDLQRLLAHGPDQDQQHYRFVSRQGRQLYCLVHFYVVRAPEGDAIRLCCTIQDQTLLQQQADDRQQLARLAQLELSLAFALSRTISQDGNGGSQQKSSVDPMAVLSPTVTVAPFVQQHSGWLLRFYCDALAASDSAKLQGPEVVSLLPVVQLIADVVQLYQPQASRSGLLLVWQPQSVSDLTRLDQHRGWQLLCGLMQLACTLAKPGSDISFELVPFQSWLTMRLQLTMADVAAQQFQQQANIGHVLPTTTLSFVQQRLLAAQFWANQLGAEFSFQQDQQQLTLQVLLQPTH